MWKKLAFLCLLFVAFFSLNAQELKKTVAVNDSSMYSYDNFLIGDSKFYFMGDDNDVYGRELWVSNGTTEGTYMIGDLNEGDADSSFTLLATLGDRLIFRDNSYYLYSTDGTEATTKFIKDLDGDSNERKVKLYSYYSEYFVKYKGALYFVRENVDNIGVELWKTDGDTTTLVKNINPEDSSYGSSSYPKKLTVVNDKLVLVANDGSYGEELWVSDGTTDGTTILKNINPNANSGTTIYYLKQTDSELYFFSNHYSSTAGDTIYTLWKTDGTVDGTVALHSSTYNEERFNVDTSDHRSVLVNNGKLFFMASYREYNTLSEEWKSKGSELWTTDGTAEGTKVVSDFNLGDSSSNFNYLRAVNDKIIFQNSNDGNRIWVSDGTVDGTYELTDNEGNSLYHYYVSNGDYESGDIDGYFYFVAKKELNDQYGYEIYVTDGTIENTHMIKDINPGADNSLTYGPQFISFNGKVYFVARTDDFGEELWVTDRTKIGTQMVHDIFYGNTNSDINIVGVMNNSLYVTGRGTSDYTYLIYSTDGEITLDENRLTDFNVTRVISETKLLCKTNPSECGITTVAPTLTTEILDAKSAGWHMVGTSTPIEDMSVFGNVDTVWKWNGTTWLVYSPNPLMQSAIQDANIESIDKLDSFDGVWIRNK